MRFGTELPSMEPGVQYLLWLCAAAVLMSSACALQCSVIHQDVSTCMILLLLLFADHMKLMCPSKEFLCISCKGLQSALKLVI